MSNKVQPFLYDIGNKDIFQNITNTNLNAVFPVVDT